MTDDSLPNTTEISINISYAKDVATNSGFIIHLKSIKMSVNKEN